MSKLDCIAYLNLVLGLQNLYTFVQLDLMFNLIIGILNIGVFAFKDTIKSMSQQ